MLLLMLMIVMMLMMMMMMMIMIMLLLMLLLVVVGDDALKTRTVAVVADPLSAVADEPPRLHLMVTMTAMMFARRFRRVLV